MDSKTKDFIIGLVAIYVIQDALKKKVPKCNNCSEGIAYTLVEWGLDSDDREWICKECYIKRYRCHKHKNKENIKKNLIRADTECEECTYE